MLYELPISGDAVDPRTLIRVHVFERDKAQSIRRVGEGGTVSICGSMAYVMVVTADGTTIQISCIDTEEALAARRQIIDAANATASPGHDRIIKLSD